MLEQEFDHRGQPGQKLKEVKQLVAKKAYDSLVKEQETVESAQATSSASVCPLSPAALVSRVPSSPAVFETAQNLSNVLPVDSPASQATDWISKLNLWLQRTKKAGLCCDENIEHTSAGPSNEPTFTCKLKVLEQEFDHRGQPGQKLKEVKQLVAKKAFEALVELHHN